MCDAPYVVCRASRQTHDISYLAFVQSYDKVARSTIEAIKINSDLLIELWVAANHIQLELHSEQLTWSSSQESQLFKTVPHAIHEAQYRARYCTRYEASNFVDGYFRLYLHSC